MADERAQTAEREREEADSLAEDAIAEAAHVREETQGEIAQVRAEADAAVARAQEQLAAVEAEHRSELSQRDSELKHARTPVPPDSRPPPPRPHSTPPTRRPSVSARPLPSCAVSSTKPVAMPMNNASGFKPKSTQRARPRSKPQPKQPPSVPISPPHALKPPPRNTRYKQNEKPWRPSTKSSIGSATTHGLNAKGSASTTPNSSHKPNVTPTNVCTP